MTEQPKRYLSNVEKLLDREIDPVYRQEETKLLSLPKEEKQNGCLQSYLFFRLEEERFALPAKNLKEIFPLKEIHKIPHRKKKALEGFTTIHGRLLIVVSLYELLGIHRVSPKDHGSISSKRMAVLEKDDKKWVVQVDETYSFHRLDPKEMQNVPVNVAKGTAPYISGMINWKGVQVGLLDPEKLFEGLGSVYA